MADIFADVWYSVMALCPLCEKAIPEENLKADSYYFTGLVRCDNCDQEVSPVLPRDRSIGAVESQDLQEGLTAWFNLPKTARDQFFKEISHDEAGRIATKILNSYKQK